MITYIIFSMKKKQIVRNEWPFFQEMEVLLNVQNLEYFFF